MAVALKGIHMREAVEGVGFGSAEVAFMLAHSNPAGSVAASALNVDLTEASPDIVAVGASSLFARGLITIDRDELSIVEAAEVAAYVISETQTSASIGLLDSNRESVDAFVMLSAPLATLVFQPRALGSWVTFAKDPDLTDAEALWAIIESFAGDHPEGTAFVSRVAGGDEETLFMQSQSNGLWDLVRGASSREGERRESAASASAARDMLGDLFAARVVEDDETTSRGNA